MDKSDSAVFIKFLERLTHDIERKIFVILDNLRAHHSRTVQEWFLEHQEKIELLLNASSEGVFYRFFSLYNNIEAGLYSTVFYSL
ncbi:MAG: transposase [Candidatus Adiutrix sp.]|nr:transposase [Candidatus Adiutrix sp.]